MTSPGRVWPKSYVSVLYTVEDIVCCNGDGSCLGNGTDSYSLWVLVPLYWEILDSQASPFGAGAQCARLITSPCSIYCDRFGNISFFCGRFRHFLLYYDHWHPKGSGLPSWNDSAHDRGRGVKVFSRTNNTWHPPPSLRSAPCLRRHDSRRGVRIRQLVGGQLLLLLRCQDGALLRRGRGGDQKSDQPAVSVTKW